MKRLMLAVVFSLMAATTFAQGVSVRFYFVPKIGDGLGPRTGFRPKYTDPGVLGAGLDVRDWSANDYGSEAVMILAANVTPEQHTALSAQQDVIAIPATLDTPISALALSTIQAKLEALNLPCEWLTTATTYRQALRTLIKIISFAGRYQVVSGRQWIFTGGVTLDTRWNQLSQAVKLNLRDTADSLGLDSSGVTATMTMRQILRAVADQLPEFTIRGETF